MPKIKTQRTWRRRGEYLTVYVLKRGIGFVTGEAKRPMTRKHYRWGVKAAELIARAVVSGDMPLGVAADWMEEREGIWHGSRETTLREWRYCVRLMRQFVTAGNGK